MSHCCRPDSNHSCILFATCSCSAPLRVHACSISLNDGRSKKKCSEFTHHRRSAGDHRFRVDKFGGAVGRAAHFAVIAILVRRFALRTGAFHKTVRQEHAFFRIVELRDGAVFNKTVLFQTGVDKLRQLAVLVAVRRVIVIIADVEAGKIGLMLLTHLANHLLRCDTELLRFGA